MNSDQLRKKLLEVLKKDPKNTDKILSLSNKLAALDTNKVRFSVDAGVIDRLGQELVARQETAVSELIKNAYDADASTVDLNFKNVSDVGGTLTIIDNGVGMNRSQLINGFMRISSTEKIHNPVSPTFTRKRAGQKGIGRFATQRLGAKLTITTQTSLSKSAFRVKIDWSKYKMDSDLYSITNKIDEISRNPELSSGTILKIEGLREGWSSPMIKRIYRYALDIIQPFPLSKKKIKNKKINDPGFIVVCKLENEAIADEQTMFFQHSLAEIEASVNNQGIATWKITKSKVGAETSKGEKIESEIKDSNGKYKFLKGINLKAYYFVYPPAKYSNLIPKQTLSYIRGIAKDYGGIRIYRNGFRVLPYGERQDDWAGLDASVRKNVIISPHGTNNFFGFIEIDGTNKEFQELSNREGLFKNKAYEELVGFTYKAIIAAVTRIASVRERKGKASQQGWISKPKSPKEEILEAADALEEIASQFEENADDKTKDESKDSNKQKSKEEKAEGFRRKAKTLRAAVEMIEEISMLRVLAGLGLVIGEFTHEIMQHLGAFDVDSQYLIDNLKKNRELLKRASRLKKTFNSFQIYASYFDETISQNVNRELKIINLQKVVNSFKDTLEKDLTRNNINLDFEFKGDEIYTKKMHESEWASILFNLYSNSKKALKRKKTNQRKIKIKIGKDNNKVYLEFMDNGDGIPKENRDKIFNAFFTTSSPKGHSASATEELSGTGLGLKIINDIIDSHNGEIFLDNPSASYNTKFRIELPKASDKEIDELWNIN